MKSIVSRVNDSLEFEITLALFCVSRWLRVGFSVRGLFDRLFDFAIEHNYNVFFVVAAVLILRCQSQTADLNNQYYA